MYKALTMEEYVVEEEKLNHEVVVVGCGSESINVSVSSKSSCDASSNAILCLGYGVDLFVQTKLKPVHESVN